MPQRYKKYLNPPNVFVKNYKRNRKAFPSPQKTQCLNTNVVKMVKMVICHFRPGEDKLVLKYIYYI